MEVTKSGFGREASSARTVKRHLVGGVLSGFGREASSARTQNSITLFRCTSGFGREASSARTFSYNSITKTKVRVWPRGFFC